ncbi:MAG TPA: hypothetical protein VGM31_13230 [Puia sp.]
MPKFADFIWYDPTNRRYLWSSLAISLVLLVLFKLIYPNPNLVMDSYYYLRAANTDADVNAWPIGYSKFLQLVGIFTHSPTALVCIQYIFLEGALLLLFFTLRFFFQMGRVSSLLLFVFFFVNPLLPYTANLIMADALFNGLSILWVTQLIWIIYRPKAHMIFTHALLLFITFTVRYNALYYPIVGAVAFILSRQRFGLKLAGIVLPALFVIGFITYTDGGMEQYCGVRQFSPFGGWKLANDALFVYAHVQSDGPGDMPARYQAVDAIVRKYFSDSHDPGDLMKPDVFHGSPFMFSGPLMYYMTRLYGADTALFINFQKWARMGPLYTDYGSYLIRKYPMAFTRWFLWPNIQRYFFPPREIYMTITPFYLRRDELGPEATRWFGLTTLTAPAKYINLRLRIMSAYPLMFFLIHMCFVLSLLGFLCNKGWSTVGRPYNYCLLAIMCFWLCDAAFSLTAAAIVMRYQILTIVLELSLSLYFLEYLYRQAFSTSSKPLYLPFQKPYEHESLERLPGKE